jgi:hypothetical protein
LIDRNGKILVLKSIKSRKRMKILSKLGMNWIYCLFLSFFLEQYLAV